MSSAPGTWLDGPADVRFMVLSPVPPRRVGGAATLDIAAKAPLGVRRSRRELWRSSCAGGIGDGQGAVDGEGGAGVLGCHCVGAFLCGLGDFNLSVL